MTRRQPIFAVMALLLLSSWGWAAEGQDTQSGNQASDGQVYGDIGARTDGNPVLLCMPPSYSAFDARLGWWAFWNKGSPSKTGEYQDLNPSPFWDLDGLSSNGTRTLNVTATGNDQETTVGKLYYFQPGFTAKVDYERFIHRLDHDPLDNLPNTNTVTGTTTTPGPGFSPPDPKFIKQDLNFGKDYAVRVQELNASFKKDISDSLRVRLDVWGMQKDGTRQVSAISKCYTQNATGTTTTPPPIIPPGHIPIDSYVGVRCHVLSEMQVIDWITSEIKPVVEARLGDNITIEYSRPMRNFTAADSITSRFYDGTGRLNYNSGTNPNPYAFAVVPDSYTQMDQVKIGAQLTDNTKAYANIMAGNTIDREINMERWFNNMDMRVTNTSLENVSLTGYGTVFNEDESFPNLANVTAINKGPANAGGVTNTLPTSASVSSGLVQPIDYHKSTAGLKSVWRPYGGGYSKEGLAIVSGYEYCDLERKFAVHNILYPTVGVFNQPRTITNSFQVGPDYRWSSSLDTYVHYKFQSAIEPLAAVQQWNGVYNSKLPQQDNIVEIGFNWVPSDWFVLNATIGVERGDNHSDLANFDEETYPMSFSAWYAVSSRLSLSAGYAVYSNFVTQDITLADQQTPPGAYPAVRGQWNYGAQAHVVTLGSRYAATERVSLTGQVEWVRGNNAITNSTMQFSTAPTTVTDLGSFSQVTNETTRVSMGVDWVILPRVVNFYRYELYNFLDKAPGTQTGTAQGILGGLSAIF